MKVATAVSSGFAPKIVLTASTLVVFFGMTSSQPAAAGNIHSIRLSGDLMSYQIHLRRKVPVSYDDADSICGGNLPGYADELQWTPQMNKMLDYIAEHITFTQGNRIWMHSVSVKNIRLYFNRKHGFLAAGPGEKAFPVCVGYDPIGCQPLDPPHDGFISNYREFATVTAKRTFSCRDGYILIGSKESECLESYTWSNNAPICRRVSVHFAVGRDLFMYRLASLTKGTLREASSSCPQGLPRWGQLENTKLQELMGKMKDIIHEDAKVWIYNLLTPTYTYYTGGPVPASLGDTAYIVCQEPFALRYFYLPHQPQVYAELVSVERLNRTAARASCQLPARYYITEMNENLKPALFYDFPESANGGFWTSLGNLQHVPRGQTYYYEVPLDVTAYVLCLHTMKSRRCVDPATFLNKPTTISQCPGHVTTTYLQTRPCQFPDFEYCGLKSTPHGQRCLRQSDLGKITKIFSDGECPEYYTKKTWIQGAICEEDLENFDYCIRTVNRGTTSDTRYPFYLDEASFSSGQPFMVNKSIAEAACPPGRVLLGNRYILRVNLFQEELGKFPRLPTHGFWQKDIFGVMRLYDPATYTYTAADDHSRGYVVCMDLEGSGQP